MSAVAERFKEQARQLTSDLRHRELIQTALRKYEAVRDKTQGAFQDWPSAREAAAETKWEAIDHLDRYLAEFAGKLEARGTKVHWASTGQQARDIILGIIRDKKARSIIKSKSMTSEEIHLNEALEHEDFHVVESDLGEFIVQLRKEAPYHIVFPAMHLSRGEISELFARELGSAPTQSPEDLTMIARRVLREKYITADVGFTGANFAIAETGMISVTENEGNARLTAALPKVMITLVGIEKVLPRFEDLALFLPMLATIGTGQPLTCYNSFYGGPRQPGECDGPEEYHVVLLDNRRTELLADAEQRDALRCIRCGGCLNVCPIFRNIGGHTYGTTYSGPIGSVITPHLRGLQDWKHLSYASSLCGACTEVCPVKINLHHHLLQNRRNATNQKPSRLEKLAFKVFAAVINRPSLYGFVKKAGRVVQKLHPLVKGTRLDPAYAWTKTRDLPPIARQTFKEYWEESEMTERENILGRIREALTVPSPPLEHEHPVALPTGPSSAGARVWLPIVGKTPAEQLALFQKNAADLRAVVYLVDTREDFVRLLLKLRDSEGWKKAGAHSGKLTDAACRALALPVCQTDKGYDVADLENCDVGITECDALVAQTGSVLVTSRSAGGRALSVLPPHHVVLARRSQLLPDLPEAFAFLKRTYASSYPSFISFITGPSRTGDIERILVLGAHGPKKLTIFILADEIGV